MQSLESLYTHEPYEVRLRARSLGRVALATFFVSIGAFILNIVRAPDLGVAGANLSCIVGSAAAYLLVRLGRFQTAVAVESLSLLA